MKEKWQQDLAAFLNDWSDDKTYILGKTSGSTGIPKTIRLSKKAMVASALRTNRFFQLKANDPVLLCLPVNYIAGKMVIVRAMVGQLNLIAVPPVSLPQWEGDIALAAMVPMQVHNLLADKEGRKRLSTVSKLLIGGSSVSESLIDKLLDFQVDSYLSYGMTETVSHVALCRVKDKKDKEDKEDKRMIYTALPDVFFTIDDRNCLVVHAPHLQEEGQAKPFVTNDVVELLSESSFCWLGRWDHVINSGGIKLFPETIECKISHLIDSRFYITSSPDEILGQQLILKVESPAWSEPEMALFRQKAAALLSKYEIPKKIVFVDKFEETDTGKVKRDELHTVITVLNKCG